MAVQKNSFISFMSSFFNKGKCDNLTDSNLSRLSDDFVSSYVAQNCKGYGGVAQSLNVSVATIRNIVSEQNIKTIHIQGNKEILLFPEQVEQVKQIITQRSKK